MAEVVFGDSMVPMDSVVASQRKWDWGNIIYYDFDDYVSTF